MFHLFAHSEEVMTTSRKKKSKASVPTVFSFAVDIYLFIYFFNLSVLISRDRAPLARWRVSPSRWKTANHLCLFFTAEKNKRDRGRNAERDLDKGKRDIPIRSLRVHGAWRKIVRSIHSVKQSARLCVREICVFEHTCKIAFYFPVFREVSIFQLRKRIDRQ